MFSPQAKIVHHYLYEQYLQYPPQNTLKGEGGEHNHTFNVEITIKYKINSMTVNPKSKIYERENSRDRGLEFCF